MAVTKYLKEAGEFVFKVASDSESRGLSQFANRHILRRNRPAKVVTIIRDPMGQIVSAFFSKAQRGKYPEEQAALRNADLEKLHRLFRKRFFDSGKYKNYLFWFEEYFNKLLGFDVYKYGFNTQSKFDVIEHDTYPTLIMHMELSNEKKSELLKSFLNNQKITIGYSNTRAEKGDKDLYREFMSSVRLPKDIVDDIYDSQFVRHFFTKTERQQLKNKWREAT